MDVTPLSMDVTPLSVDVTPLSMDVTPLSMDVTPLSVDVTPLSVDVTPLSMDVTVTPLSMDVTPLSVDVTPLSVDVTPLSMDVTVTPLSVDVTPLSVDVTPLSVATEATEMRCGDTEEGDGSYGASRSVIDVNFCGSTALLWRTSDVKAARDAGLAGSLVGSLPRQPRQNGRLGRPLQLSQEEVRLLLETGRAVLVPPGDEGGEGEPHQERVERYEERQERSFQEQSVLALEDRKVALLRAMSGPHKGGGPTSPTTDGAVAERLKALDEGFVFPRSAMAVQLTTARAGMSHGAEERAFRSACWPPQSQGSERRFLVFRDLRQRGYCVTSAGKFGGDFLVYPGDPLRFHAHFIAVCVDREEELPLLDVLAVARLGSNVKKTVLLCSPGPEAGQVLYTSLQWSGMV